MTPIHDILAWNPLAAALMVDFGQIPERERNFMRLLFTDPRMHSLYPDWEGLARSAHHLHRRVGLPFRAGATRARRLGRREHRPVPLTGPSLALFRRRGGC
jgi:hypothetical protein